VNCPERGKEGDPEPDRANGPERGKEGDPEPHRTNGPERGKEGDPEPHRTNGPERARGATRNVGGPPDPAAVADGQQLCARPPRV